MAQSPAQEAEPRSPVAPSRMADAGPWAVTAFATTSFMLGLYNTHLIGSGSLPIVYPVAFFYGGLVQIIVGILEAIRGNLFGAVVFGSFGPFWVIYGSINVWFVRMATPASVGTGLAEFLAAYAVVTFYFFLASLKTDWTLVVTLGLIVIGLVLLAIGEGTRHTTWTEAGGWVTLLYAVLAWYHAAADLIGFTFGRRVLPVGTIGR